MKTPTQKPATPTDELIARLKKAYYERPINPEYLAEATQALMAMNAMVPCLRAFVDGFKSDPGTWNLDNEQPIASHVDLGTWRKADSLLAKLRLA